MAAKIRIPSSHAKRCTLSSLESLILKYSLNQYRDYEPSFCSNLGLLQSHIYLSETLEAHCIDLREQTLKTLAGRDLNIHTVWLQ